MPSYRLRYGWTFLALAPALTGCSHMVEKRIVNDFAQGVEQGNLAELRDLSTPGLSSAAFGNESSIEALKLVRIPTGKQKVVKVEEVSETERKVTVEAESGRKAQYRLVRATPSAPWAVDDLYLRQQHDGLTVVKSVSEQLELVASIRQVAETLHEGNREQVLMACAPDLRAALDVLPATSMHDLVSRCSPDDAALKTFRPQIEINGERSRVKLNRADGAIVMSLQRENRQWTIEDVAVEARAQGQHVNSLRKTALATHTADRFLAAYAAANKSALSDAATANMYRRTLLPSDLSLQPLPTLAELAVKPEVKLLPQQADVILTLPDQLVQLKLREAVEPVDGELLYRVDDVTLYASDSGENRSLAGILLANSIAELFTSAIQSKDLSLIRQIVTPEFDRQVVGRLTDETFAMLPLHGLGSAPPVITGSKFRGTLTELDIDQGGTPLTLLLRTVNGDVQVDDVRFADHAHSVSLRDTWSTLIPVYEFAVALRQADAQRLLVATSEDFRRRVWTQLDAVPKIDAAVATDLMGDLVSREEKDGVTRLVLRKDSREAEVHLVVENGRLVIDDALLMKPDQESLASLKQALRLEVAYQARLGRQQVQLASGSTSTPADTVAPAVFETASQLDTTTAVTEPQPFTGELLLQPIPIE